MTEPRTGLSSKVFVLLVVSLVVLIAATVLLLPTDPLIAARINAIIHPSAIARQNFNPDDPQKYDPPYGTPLPDAGAGKALRNLPVSDHGYIIVALGDCAQCMRFDFKTWQDQAELLHVPIVGLSGASDVEMKAFQKETGVTMPIQFDVMDRLQQAVNGYWAGRVYYYDKDWKLQWKMEGFGNSDDLNHQPSLRELIKGEGQ